MAAYGWTEGVIFPLLQNAALQQSQTLLLKYASTLAREKNVLVQRTLELTERWNQVKPLTPTTGPPV